MIRFLNFTEINRFIPSSRGFVGRLPKDQVALAQSFVAKAVLNLLTSVVFFDRLKVVQALGRICGFERFHAIPDSTRTSPIFAEFTALELQLRVHEAQIHAQLP